MTSDFAHYLHLHRVRTVIQILTPWLEVGLPVCPIVSLLHFRTCPGSAHAAATEQRTGGCLPLAIDDAAFERMSHHQLTRISSDVVRCIQLYYGDRVRLRG